MSSNESFNFDDWIEEDAQPEIAPQSIKRRRFNVTGFNDPHKYQSGVNGKQLQQSVVMQPQQSFAIQQQQQSQQYVAIPQQQQTKQSVAIPQQQQRQQIYGAATATISAICGDPTTTATTAIYGAATATISAIYGDPTTAGELDTDLSYIARRVRTRCAVFRKGAAGSLIKKPPQINAAEVYEKKNLG